MVKALYQKSKFRKVMLILALLSLNILEQSAGVISATIPLMVKTFNGYSIVQVEMATTIVSIFVTVFVMASGVISNWIGQKQTAVLGLLVAAVSSVIPVFSSNFHVVIISRAIFGVGIGLANPLAISLIGEFFNGDTLANLMGWRSAVAGLGQSLMTFCAGYLLTINWHMAYTVYFLFIPALIFFVFFVPEPERFGLNADNSDEEKKEKESKFTWKGFSTVLGLALILFATMVISMIAYIKLAEFYVESHIGTPTQASTVLSIFGIAQLVGSALFGIVYKLFKNWTLYIGMLLSAIPLIGIGYAHSNLVVTVMFILMGLLGGLAIPYIFTKVAGVTNTKNAPLFNGIVLVGSNMGSFCAPILGKVLGGASARLAMLHGGYLLFIITIIVILIMEVIRRMKRVM